MPRGPLIDIVWLLVIVLIIIVLLDKIANA